MISEEDQFYKWLGAEIKRVRMSTRMTQKVLAERIGCDVRQICYIEGGRRTLSAYRLHRIMNILPDGMWQWMDWNEQRKGNA